MNHNDNAQQATLAALSMVRLVILLALSWFLVSAALCGVVVMLAGANVIFVLLMLLSAAATLFSLVLGVSVLRDALCQGASGVWTRPLETTRFRLQLLWLLLSGFLFAFALMAL